MLITIGLLLALGGNAAAQDTTSPAATADPAKQQEEKAKLEAKASVMLEQVISEAQALKLPENKIRVQIVAGDLLWDRSAARARSLFNDAGAMLGQMMLESAAPDTPDRQMLNRLRQELVLSSARHDAELAYSLLRQTQPPANPSANAGNRRRGMFDGQDNLEQSLLAVIANTDPKVAYQKASESLDKGEYPNSLTRVLAQLQSKDPDNFKKLSDKTLSRLNSDSLLGNSQATNLALGLLRPGPQGNTTAAGTAGASSAANNARVLSESSFHDLLDNAITAALTAAPRTNTGGANQRRAQRGEAVMIGGDANGGVFMTSPPPPLDPAQVQQNNARMLLRGLQGMLPQIDQYLPERSQAVRQKLTELNMGNNSLADFGNQMRNVMTQGDSESLANAASTAPPPLQSRLYQEAARRAVDEGNTDRALQIASEHLDESSRNSIMQAVDFKKLTTTVSAEKMGEIRQKLAALSSDAERVKYLADLALATQKDNPKLALRFAEDARSLVSKRATDYEDLGNQLKVAEVFASIDPKRSFEVLEPGITQLNELLVAAQVLSGFEVDVFRDGELPLQGGGSELGMMVTRYGQQLASLAKLDFEHAQITAEKFQMAEPRLMAKLAIIQGAFGVRSSTQDRRFDNFRFMTR
ncbi:MAG TPA: hypothetical protein VIU65_04245 [Pyrinomonadaceae bacterium]